MRVSIPALVFALAAPFGAVAQIVDGADARAQLFDVRGVSVRVFNLPMLSDEDKRVIGEVARQQKYYGAVAISPDEGLMSEATLAAANFHGIPAAERKARASCDAMRRAGSARCVIAAHILPVDHRPGRLELSVDATAAFRDGWSGEGPKALAISPATGEWAIARGQGAGAAATGACNRKAAEAGGADCAVIVAD